MIGRLPIRGRLPINGRLPIKGRLTIGRLPMKGRLPMIGRFPIMGRFPIVGRLMMGRLPIVGRLMAGRRMGRRAVRRVVTVRLTVVRRTTVRPLPRASTIVEEAIKAAMLNPLRIMRFIVQSPVQSFRGMTCVTPFEAEIRLMCYKNLNIPCLSNAPSLCGHIVNNHLVLHKTDT